MSEERESVEIENRSVTVQAVVRCMLCGDTMTIDGVTGKRAARRAAELAAWIGVGPGGFDMICPKHEIDCPHCDRPMPRDVAIRARQTQRARAQQREAEWRERHVGERS